MGKVVELLGIPGCGKSTLVDYCMPNPNYIIQRKDLKTTKEKRRFMERFLIKFDFIKDTSIVHKYIEEYPEANELFVRKLAVMHHKLKYMDAELALLDEGLIDRMTGIAFDCEIIVDNVFLQFMDIVNKMETLVFKCQCPIDVSIKRLSSRERTGDNKMGRYYDEDDEIIRNKLMMKQYNIDTALSFFNGHVVMLDMMQPIDVNATIVRDVICKQFPDIKGELWLNV